MSYDKTEDATYNPIYMQDLVVNNESKYVNFAQFEPLIDTKEVWWDDTLDTGVVHDDNKSMSALKDRLAQNIDMLKSSKELSQGGVELSKKLIDELQAKLRGHKNDDIRKEIKQDLKTLEQLHTGFAALVSSKTAALTRVEHVMSHLITAMERMVHGASVGAQETKNATKKAGGYVFDATTGFVVAGFSAAGKGLHAAKDAAVAGGKQGYNMGASVVSSVIALGCLLLNTCAYAIGEVSGHNSKLRNKERIRQLEETVQHLKEVTHYLKDVTQLTFKDTTELKNILKDNAHKVGVAASVIKHMKENIPKEPPHDDVSSTPNPQSK